MRSVNAMHATHDHPLRITLLSVSILLLTSGQAFAGEGRTPIPFTSPVTFPGT